MNDGIKPDYMLRLPHADTISAQDPVFRDLRTQLVVDNTELLKPVHYLFVYGTLPVCDIEYMEKLGITVTDYAIEEAIR